MTANAGPLFIEANGFPFRCAAVSACLLGIPCRYDGRAKPAGEWIAAARGMELMPVCPEIFGGLGTPRPRCAISQGDGADVLDGRAEVVNENGERQTDAFRTGARRTLEFLHMRNIDTFIGTARSPSCGRGRHSVFGELHPGDGVTTALLKRHGIRVIESPWASD